MELPPEPPGLEQRSLDMTRELLRARGFRVQRAPTGWIARRGKAQVAIRVPIDAVGSPPAHSCGHDDLWQVLTRVLDRYDGPLTVLVETGEEQWTGGEGLADAWRGPAPSVLLGLHFVPWEEGVVGVASGPATAKGVRGTLRFSAPAHHPGDPADDALSLAMAAGASFRACVQAAMPTAVARVANLSHNGTVAVPATAAELTLEIRGPQDPSWQAALGGCAPDASWDRDVLPVVADPAVAQRLAEALRVSLVREPGFGVDDLSAIPAERVAYLWVGSGGGAAHTPAWSVSKRAVQAAVDAVLRALEVLP